MADMFFYSDPHFGHYNIIQYANRPFKNAEEMDETLIDNWNETVSDADHVYVLGDVTMARLNNQRGHFIRTIQRLKGHKRLIMGNHDHFPVPVYLAAGFQKIRGEGQWFKGLLLSHYPVHGGSLGNAKANVHGHIHSNPSPPPAQWVSKDHKHHVVPYINVSVENIDYRPIAIEDVWKRIEKAGGERL